MSSAPSQQSPRARVVLVAAGASLRMRRDGEPILRKPWLDLGGRPVLEVAAAAVSAAPEVIELVIVAHADDVQRVEALAGTSPAFHKLVAVLAGGIERADSVRLGAHASEVEVDVIAVHDAARPLVDPAAVSRAIRMAHVQGAALLAIPVTDTIKESDDGERAQGTLERARLWAAQTPQCFRAKEFLALLDRAQAEGFAPTDDAALWERWVGPVSLVLGTTANRKITTAVDLQIARALLIEDNHTPDQHRDN